MLYGSPAAKNFRLKILEVVTLPSQACLQKCKAGQASDVCTCTVKSIYFPATSSCQKQLQRKQPRSASKNKFNTRRPEAWLLNSLTLKYPQPVIHMNHLSSLCWRSILEESQEGKPEGGGSCSAIAHQKRALQDGNPMTVYELKILPSERLSKRVTVLYQRSSADSHEAEFSGLTCPKYCTLASLLKPWQGKEVNHQEASEKGK
ncbi:uncharacterized protein ACDP82_004280 [Pangshura tecta]